MVTNSLLRYNTTALDMSLLYGFVVMLSLLLVWVLHRYGKRFSGGIGFQTCYDPGRYYYGSAGYPDVSPYPVHIVAANADDLGA